MTADWHSAHEFRDVQPSALNTSRCYARCWCGWVSVPTFNPALARALHGEHVAYLSDGPKVVKP